MFNLLPEPEKKQIINEYNSRRTLIGLAFLFVVGIISIVAIFPSYVLSSSRVSEAEGTIHTMKSSSILKEEADLNASLSQSNLKLQALRPSKSEPDVASLFQSVIAVKGNSVRLIGFLFSPGSGTTKSKLSIQGIAKSRTDLSAFVDGLKKNPQFTAVDLPVSSFTKDQNADFAIEITGNF